MAGRTHLQHALPTTFGNKLAVSLHALHTHHQALDSLKSSCLVVQLGGAAGTLASLTTPSHPPPSIQHLRRTFATHLALSPTPIPWHVDRTPILRIAHHLTLISTTLSKLALDLALQSATELAEIAEPYLPGRGASSTMPQKRNPISCERILAGGHLMKGYGGMMAEAGAMQDFERAGFGGWHVEWVVVPEVFVVMSGMLREAEALLAGLRVDEERMRRNLGMSRGLIVGEAVMMELGGKEGWGRMKAHDVVYEACRVVSEDTTGEKGGLFEVLCGVDEVVKTLGEDKLRELCDVGRYLGAAEQMVDDVVAAMDMA